MHPQRVRRSILAEVAGFFSRVDLIATPTVSRAAPPLDEIDSYLASFFAVQDLPFHTGYWNATGYPVVSVPIGLTAAGLPLGGQLVGRPFEDATVLGAADAFQRVTDWQRSRAARCCGAPVRDLARPRGPAGG